MNEVLVFDAVRTPRGRVKQGELQRVTPIRLAASPLEAIRTRTGIAGDVVDDVMFGCVVPVGEQGGNLTRSAVLAAGFDSRVPGSQINRFCSSGLDAVNMMAAQVAAGQSDLAIGGGVESMSRIPMGSDHGSWVSDPRETFQTRYIPQGVAADAIATLHGFTRSDVDAYAVRSQQLAAAARDQGHFARSIAPVKDLNDTIVLAQDDNIRPTTTLESLANLEPAFARMAHEQGYGDRLRLAHPEIGKLSHVHTAGNSSAIVDGAAAVLLGSRAGGERHGLRPRARIRGWSAIGAEPTLMLTGPAPATRRALKTSGMELSDIDLIEINEAFASVVLSFVEETGVPLSRVNVSGGAIALGHPLGATGAMLVGILLDDLERRDLQTGLVTLCVAGGMGAATIIERI